MPYLSALDPHDSLFTTKMVARVKPTPVTVPLPLVPAPTATTSSPPALEKTSKEPHNKKKKNSTRSRSLLPPDSALTESQVVKFALEDFNELMAKSNMDEEAQSYFRDLRRKGKNRVSK